MKTTVKNVDKNNGKIDSDNENAIINNNYLYNEDTTTRTVSTINSLTEGNEDTMKTSVKNVDENNGEINEETKKAFIDDNYVYNEDMIEENDEEIMKTTVKNVDKNNGKMNKDTENAIINDHYVYNEDTTIRTVSTINSLKEDNEDTIKTKIKNVIEDKGEKNEDTENVVINDNYEYNEITTMMTVSTIDSLAENNGNTMKTTVKSVFENNGEINEETKKAIINDNYVFNEDTTVSIIDSLKEDNEDEMITTIRNVIEDKGEINEDTENTVINDNFEYNGITTIMAFSTIDSLEKYNEDTIKTTIQSVDEDNGEINKEMEKVLTIDYLEEDNEDKINAIIKTINEDNKEIKIRKKNTNVDNNTDNKADNNNDDSNVKYIDITTIVSSSNNNDVDLTVTPTNKLYITDNELPSMIKVYDIQVDNEGVEVTTTNKEYYIDAADKQNEVPHRDENGDYFEFPNTDKNDIIIITEVSNIDDKDRENKESTTVLEDDIRQIDKRGKNREMINIDTDTNNNDITTKVQNAKIDKKGDDKYTQKHPNKSPFQNQLLEVLKPEDVLKAPRQVRPIEYVLRSVVKSGTGFLGLNLWTTQRSVTRISPQPVYVPRIKVNWSNYFT